MRVGVICDLNEEGWPSMDLVGETLVASLQAYKPVLAALKVQRPMKRRFSTLAPFRGNVLAINGDRFLNRFHDYPRYIRSMKNDFDLFHIIDHSYSQLAHELPPERTIITCHDLDTFRCLLDPAHNHRSILFKAMTKRILVGFRKAARVICDSAATRDELLTYELLPPDRVVAIPLGVHPSCTPASDASADTEAARFLGQCCNDQVDILHVGSTIPRKRIDLLLRVFALVKKELPRARLLRAGGGFTPGQMKLVEQLDLAESIVNLPFLDRGVLAAVYRRAALVLLPSDREGFGLPVIEALACGTPVVASDLPVLREVGGNAAVYSAVDDARAWSSSVVALLSEKREQPDRWLLRRLHATVQAKQFSWETYTQKVVDLYKELL